MKKLIILGGGLSGLSAGEKLSKHFNVMILERNSFLGGLAANLNHNGKDIPMFYHHIIKSNKQTQEYLKKFAGIDDLDWKKIKVAIGVNNNLFTVNSPAGLLGTDYLSFYEKMRFGFFGFYSLVLMNPDKISEGLDAETWLNKYAGKAITDKIFFHLYSRNKFNIPLSRISAKQFANRLYEKEVQDDFSFPKEGYQGMIDSLARAIKQNNGSIKTSTNITEINLDKKYVIESGKRIDYDILINTTPFETFLKITKGLSEEFRRQLSKIKYCPAVGICFATEDFLKKDTYWINLFNERIHIIMQHSVLNYVYDDKISWCLRYGGSEEDLPLTGEEIKKEYLGVVKKYFPDAKIKWAKVIKTRFAEPIYDIDYHKYMPDYRAPVKGLYFAGIQLTHPKIRNMNVALESGIKVANIILEDLEKNIA
jgi:protoporphyrinogen oxidase